MPSVKDIARTVIQQNWALPDRAFDALWTEFTNNPSATITTGLENQPALGATGHGTDPATIALIAFTRVLAELVADTNLASILPHLQRIAIELGHKGIGVIVTNAAMGAFPLNTIVTAPIIIATAYTHERPTGYSLTEEDCAKLKSRRVVIYIYHPRELSERKIGIVYFNRTPSADPQANATPIILPPRQYLILRHLLKHAADRERPLADFVEHCWMDAKLAEALRNHEDDAERQRDTFTTGISKLSTILKTQLNIAARSGGKDSWELTPPPSTYCLIEEH